MNILDENYNTSLNLANSYIENPNLFKDKRREIQYFLIADLLKFLERNELFELCADFLNSFQMYHATQVVFNGRFQPQHLANLGFLILGGERAILSWD